MITNISGSYEQRLAQLGLTTLEENRQRGDMVEMFKIVTGKTKVDYSNWFNFAPVRQGAGNTIATTGYLNVEEPPRAGGEVRKNFFSHRAWNST